jgi:protein-disulfide isomerase
MPRTVIAGAARITAVLSAVAFVVLAQGPVRAQSDFPADTPAQTGRVPPALGQALLRDPGQMVAGNPAGSISIVEFFDYRCPFCRAMQPRLQRLMAADPRIRLVLKEWPLLGAQSVHAARVAIAASWQGKYGAVHDALLDLRGGMDEAQVRDAIAAVGVDMARLDRDMAAGGARIDAVLARDADEAKQLGLSGTPGFVTGTHVIPGSVSFDDLRDIVNASVAPR